MKALTIALTFLLLFVLPAVAQKTEGLISKFDKNQKAVRDSLAGYDTVFRAIGDKSAEGGELIGYFKNNKLALMQVSYFGETGKRITEYYYMDDLLYLVEDTYFKYNRPIYWDAEKAREQGDSVIFDSAKTEIDEHDKYYFRGSDMIEWLSHGKPVNKKLAAYKGGEMMIPKQADELKRKLAS